MWGLTHKSLDGGDEPFSLAMAQQPLGEMFELFGFEANGTIHSILQWPLVRISEAEMAVNPYAIYQSQHARPFSLVMPESLQGDVPNGAALRWARRNCKVTERQEPRSRPC